MSLLLAESILLDSTFKNNFQDHRWVTEQLLETKAAGRKPEAPNNLQRGLLEGISQLVSDFIEATVTLIWLSFTKRQLKFVKL